MELSPFFPLFTLLKFTAISLTRLRGAVFGTNRTVLLLIQYETFDTLIRKIRQLGARRQTSCISSDHLGEWRDSNFKQETTLFTSFYTSFHIILSKSTAVNGTRKKKQFRIRLNPIWGGGKKSNVTQINDFCIYNTI